MTENQSKINPFTTGVAPGQVALNAAGLFQNKPPQTTIFSIKKDVENNPDQFRKNENIEPKQQAPQELFAASSQLFENKTLFQNPGVKNLFGKVTKLQKQGQTSPQVNPFAGATKQQNFFRPQSPASDISQTKLIKENQGKQQNNLSLQAIQSNSIPSSSFALVQNPKPSQTESKGLFGISVKPLQGNMFSTGNEAQKNSIFASSTNPDKKETLFGQTKKQENGGLFGSLKISKEGELFSSNQTQEQKKDLLDQKDTCLTEKTNEALDQKKSLGLNTDSFEEESKSPEEEMRCPENTEQRPRQEKKKAYPSVIHEEGSEFEDESIAFPKSEIVQKDDDKLETKKAQIIECLKEMKEKDEVVKLSIRPSTNDFYKRNLEKIDKEIGLQREKASQAEKTIEQLKQLNSQKQAKIRGLRSQFTEFSFASLTKQSQQNNPIKTYPDKEAIKSELQKLTAAIEQYYTPERVHIQKSEIHQDQTAEKELNGIQKTIQQQGQQKQNQLREQKLFIAENASKLKRIEFLRTFGNYANAQNQHNVKEEAFLKQSRGKLIEELEKLRKENEEKKNKYEQMKAKVREYSPPQKITTGRSSMMMESTIYGD